MSIYFKTVSTLDDIELLQQLAKQTWQETYLHITGQAQIDYMIKQRYNTSLLLDEMKEGVIFQFVCDVERIVGYISVGVYDVQVKDAILHKLYLLKSEHGRGFGRCMLAQCVELAKTLDCKTLRLNVNQNNAHAIKVYTAAGFKKIDELHVDIGAGFSIDDLVLQRTLSE